MPKLVLNSFIFKLYFLPLILTFSTTAVVAGENEKTLLIADHVQEYNLAPFLYFYEDKSQQLSFKDVKKKQTEFFKNHKALPNFGLTNSIYWGKFKVKGLKKDERKWYLYLDYPLLKNFDVYLDDGIHPVKVLRSGFDVKNSDKFIKLPRPAIPIQINAQKLTVYFRCISRDDTLEVPLFLTSAPLLTTKTNYESLFYGLYFGVMLIMMVYNFFIYLMVRDKSYLYYTLHVLFTGISILGVTGYLALFFFSGSYTAYHLYTTLNDSIAPIFSILFAREFLNLKTNSPRLNRILQVYMFLYAFNYLIMFISTVVFASIYFILLSTGSIVVLIVGLRLYKKFVYTRFYTHAWIIYLIFLILYSLKAAQFNVPSTKYNIEIGQMIEVTLFAFALAYRIRSLQNEVHRDHLTGLHNRKSLKFFLEHQIAEITNGSPHSLCLLILDIDNFKKINDTYGHETGDIILQEITYAIQKSVRLGDFVARWGGEEFVIIFTRIDGKGAARASEKIRKSIEAYSFSVKKKVTASIGMTFFKNGESLRDFFDRADKALYKAKKSGKNKVKFI